MVLDDRARIDCLTATHAVEFDFAPKWAEGVGQALYYGLKAVRTPGVVLIMTKKGDQGFQGRLVAVAGKHGIDVWTMSPKDL